MKEFQPIQDLLYVSEHLSCKNYLMDISTGFKYEEYAAGEVAEKESVSRNYILFIIEGECSLSHNSYTNNFKGGDMVLIPRTANMRGVALSDIKILFFAFDIPQSGCDKLIFSSLRDLSKDVPYCFVPTQIRYPLTAFIDLLIYCLRNKMNCSHLHEMKHRELFMYLRAFYTKEEVAAFLHPMLGSSWEFKDFVLNNYQKVNTISELAQLLSMSRSVFFKKFKAEFGETFGHWKVKQLKVQIIFRATQPNVSSKEIMTEFGFNSATSFNRFCKGHFGCNPSELIDTIRANNE